MQFYVIVFAVARMRIYTATWRTRDRSGGMGIGRKLHALIITGTVCRITGAHATYQSTTASHHVTLHAYPVNPCKIGTPLDLTIVAAMGPWKRFYFLCCVMILFRCSDSFIGVEEKLRGTPNACCDLNDLDFYSANCELKSSRKGWLKNKLYSHSNDKYRFTNPKEFIQSLIFLISFGWCVMMSGIVLGIIFLSQLHILVHPISLKDLIDAMRLFVFFSECEIFSPIESNFEMQSCVSFNIHGKHHIQSVSTTWELDNIFAVILMLLLISGDIELNPGPKDRIASSNPPSSETPADDPMIPEKGNSPSDIVQFPGTLPTVDRIPTTTYSNTVESPHTDSQMPFENPENIDRLTSNVDEPAKALSMVTPAELNSSDQLEVNEISDTSNSNSVADQRRIQIRTPDCQPKGETTSSDTIKPFEQQGGNYGNDVPNRGIVLSSMAEKTMVQPREQTSVHTYVVFTPSSHHTKYATSEQEELEESQKEPQQKLQEEQQLEGELSLQEELEQQLLVHPQQELAPDFFEVEHCYPSNGEFATEYNGRLDSESHKFEDSFAKYELDDCTMMFFTLANRLHRAGCPCNYCSLCGRCKKDASRDSHIFPEGLLKVFRRIHCCNSMANSATKSGHDVVPKKYAEFMYDFVLDERFGTSAWTYDLLCGTCELNCSAAEGKLRSVYIRMMASDDLQPHELFDKDIWFHYILAMIMFRGLLVSEKLCFTDINFNRRFTELWNFCKSDPKSFTDASVPDLRLFLLPNRAINEEMMTFLYSFECSLRSPMFTRHIRSTKNGEFFYWKFDCFHVVFTLDDTSEKYFKKFQHILHERLENRQLMLRWTDTCSTITRTTARAIKIEYNDDLSQRLFPPALFEENIALNKEFVTRICDQASVRDFQSNLLPSCKVMTNRYRGLGHKYPLLDSDVSSTDTYSTTPLSFIKIDFDKRNDDEYIEEAIRLSPLRFPERIAELEHTNALVQAMQDVKLTEAKKILELEEQLSEVKKKRKQDEDKYKAKQKSSGDMIVKLKESQKQLKERIRKCNKMVLKELRLKHKQEELKEPEYTAAQKVLKLCIEVMKLNGVNLSPGVRKLCQGYIGSDQESLNYANLEYLDLSFPAGGKRYNKTSNSVPIMEVLRTVSC